MKCILVAGSEGALGKFLVKSLLPLYRVIRVGRSVQEAQDVYRGDLLDLRFVQGIFADHKIDYVIHCAALWTGFHSDFYIAYNNSVMMLNVLQACHDISKFVLVSSAGVYEKIEPPLEDVTVNPESSYGLSKIFSENLVRLKAGEQGFPFTIWRPFHIVSPEEGYKPGSSHICTNISKWIIEDRGDVDIKRFVETRLSMVWVQDVVDLIVSSLNDARCNNEIFNLGNMSEGTPLAVFLEIIRLAKEWQLIPEKPKYPTPSVPDFPDDGRFSRAYRILKWKAPTDFYSCIRKFLRYKYFAETKYDRR